MLSKMLVILAATVISSCASFDGDLTKFQPLRQDNGQQIYLFTTSANAIYPIDSDNAEKTRITWLEKWLRNQGLNDKNYKIIERKAVKDEAGLLGTNYFLYYEVETNKL